MNEMLHWQDERWIERWEKWWQKTTFQWCQSATLTENRCLITVFAGSLTAIQVSSKTKQGMNTGKVSVDVKQSASRGAATFRSSQILGPIPSVRVVRIEVSTGRSSRNLPKGGTPKPLERTVPSSWICRRMGRLQFQHELGKWTVPACRTGSFKFIFPFKVVCTQGLQNLNISCTGACVCVRYLHSFTCAQLAVTKR